jgi:hypothetical protein
MLLVVVAIVLLALLCLVNMMITFAVLRRLQSHEERLAAQPSSQLPGADALIGRQLPEFTATSVAGVTVSRSDLIGRTRLLGIFSATCKPCHEQALAFAEFADPDRVALVTDARGRDDAQQRMLTELGPSPTVILEPDSGTLAGELGVTAFPTLLRLDDDGRIVQVESALSLLIPPTRV